jgi:hypothetical protein
VFFNLEGEVFSLFRPRFAATCCLLSLLTCIAHAQNTSMSVFGFTDFTAEEKIDQSFLKVPDAQLAGEHLKILTRVPHIANSTICCFQIPRSRHGNQHRSLQGPFQSPPGDSD